MKVASLIIIFLLGIFLRFYHLEETASFSYDEARDARVVRDMVLEKNLTFLGPESVIGEKTIYFGPLHYYLLVLPLAISKFNPLFSYYFTAILGVVTIILIYLLTKSKIAAAFYAFFPVAVFYNRWPWNPNTIPFFTTLALISLKKRRHFIAGILVGMTFQLHFTAGVLFLIFLFWMLRKKEGIRQFILLAAGAIFGILPLMLFDVKNDFLYLRSVISLTDANWGYRGFNWHYFLWLLPFLALGIAKLPKRLGAAIVSLSFVISFYLLVVNKSVGIENPKIVEKLAEIISNDQKKSNLPFNVVSLTTADARGTSLRFYLERSGQKPLTFSEYSVADHIYVVSFDKQFKYNDIYEIKSFGPKLVSRLGILGDRFIYRLEK